MWDRSGAQRGKKKKRGEGKVERREQGKMASVKTRQLFYRPLDPALIMTPLSASCLLTWAAMSLHRSRDRGQYKMAQAMAGHCVKHLTGADGHHKKSPRKDTFPPATVKASCQTYRNAVCFSRAVWSAAWHCATCEHSAIVEAWPKTHSLPTHDALTLVRPHCQHLKVMAGDETSKFALFSLYKEGKEDKAERSFPSCQDERLFYSGEH